MVYYDHDAIQRKTESEGTEKEAKERMHIHEDEVEVYIPLKKLVLGLSIQKIFCSVSFTF